MKRHKLSFANRPVHEQLAICQRVADGVATLPAEQRELLAEIPIADSTEAAAKACAAVEAAKLALKAALHDRKIKLRAARQHADYIGLKLSSKAADDPAAFLRAGLEVAKEKQPVGLPSAPAHLRARATDFEGRAKLRWLRPVRRCTFLVEMTTDPNAATGWKQVRISLRQSCEVDGLESGKKYWFRLAASNAHGQGPWSQAVSVRVK